MENGSKYVYIGKGVFRGFLLTLVLILIYCIIATFVDINAAVRSVFFIVGTSLSIMYGSVYATKKIKKKGWVIGFFVAMIYILIIYLISLIAGREVVLSSNDFYRILLAALVGILSGMLGINI